MQIKAAYRLRSYRITEYETGILWWESHFDFGKQRSGECFILGNILLIKPWVDEKDGLLIGEFLDQLKKLPSWDKTLYYCFFSEILEVKSGGKLSADLLKHMDFRKNTQTAEVDGFTGLPQSSYRIDRYLITINDDRTISWQTPRGIDKVVGGPGRIESGILFLGPMQGDEIKQSRQDFLNQLSRLPEWTMTKAWCRYSALRSCQEKQKIRLQGNVPTQPEKIYTPVGSGYLSTLSQNQKKETPQENLSPNFTALRPLPSFSSWSNKFKWPTFSRPGFSRKIIWITGLIVFLFSGLIIAAIIIFHELEEKSYRIFWYKKHHHEHHEHRGGHHSRLGLSTFLSIFLLSLFSFLAIDREAKAEEKHIILGESGIHYPGGFDLNTVGEIQGKATHSFRPEKGPIRFHLTTDREHYTVLTSPSWYWNEKQVKISEGTEVVVRGSKSFGKDGKLYIVAQELRIPATGQSFYFRGKDGTPLWKSPGGTRRESPGGFDSSTGGRGGFGTGGGGRGHGRR